MSPNRSVPKCSGTIPVDFGSLLHYFLLLPVDLHSVDFRSLPAHLCWLPVDFLSLAVNFHSLTGDFGSLPDYFRFFPINLQSIFGLYSVISSMNTCYSVHSVQIAKCQDEKMAISFLLNKIELPIYSKDPKDGKYIFHAFSCWIRELNNNFSTISRSNVFENRSK